MNALRRRTVLGSLAVAALPLASLRRALAQGWPERPITFICPWPAGGTADQSMRALCGVAGRVLGRSIAVENRAGASGMIGAKAIASAKPDGYTIGQIPISVARFSQLGTLQADPRKDFSYLARTSGQTFGIAVHVVVDAPNGIGAPRGLEPAAAAKLRDAFRQAVASPEFKAVAEKIDAPVLYLDGPDYEKYVHQIYARETVLIDKLKLRELMKS